LPPWVGSGIQDIVDRHFVAEVAAAVAVLVAAAVLMAVAVLGAVVVVAAVLVAVAVVAAAVLEAAVVVAAGYCCQRQSRKRRKTLLLVLSGCHSLYNAL